MSCFCDDDYCVWKQLNLSNRTSRCSARRWQSCGNLYNPAPCASPCRYEYVQPKRPKQIKPKDNIKLYTCPFVGNTTYRRIYRNPYRCKRKIVTPPNRKRLCVPPAPAPPCPARRPHRPVCWYPDSVKIIRAAPTKKLDTTSLYRPKPVRNNHTTNLRLGRGPFEHNTISRMSYLPPSWPAPRCDPLHDCGEEIVCIWPQPRCCHATHWPAPKRRHSNTCLYY